MIARHKLHVLDILDATTSMWVNTYGTISLNDMQMGMRLRSLANWQDGVHKHVGRRQTGAGKISTTSIGHSRW